MFCAVHRKAQSTGPSFVGGAAGAHTWRCTASVFLGVYSMNLRSCWRKRITGAPAEPAGTHRCDGRTVPCMLLAYTLYFICSKIVGGGRDRCTPQTTSDALSLSTPPAYCRPPPPAHPLTAPPGPSGRQWQTRAPAAPGRASNRSARRPARARPPPRRGATPPACRRAR